MRLSQHEISTLITATKKCFGESARIWLFGSRVDDNKHGGDIDLYIETDLTEKTVEAKLQMRSEIWSVFGEQKIDLLVRPRTKPRTAMQDVAMVSAVELSLFLGPPQE